MDEIDSAGQAVGRGQSDIFFSVVIKIIELNNSSHSFV